MRRPCEKTHPVPIPERCSMCARAGLPEWRERWGLPVTAPEPPAPAAGWPRRLDENTIPGPGWRINPSIIDDGDGYILCYRDARAGSRLWVGRLDAELRPAGEFRRLTLDHPDCEEGQEDPRLFRHGGQLHVSFTGVVRCGTGLHTNVLYARLSDDLAAEEVFSPLYPGRNLWEKNWSFFDHGDDLFAVYSIAPHRVLRIDGGRADLAHETPFYGPWRGGEMRGGAPPVLVGDEFWHFFHDRTAGGVYRCGLYTFAAEPPFAPLRYAPAPVISADLATWSKDIWHLPVIFPAGAVRVA